MESSSSSTLGNKGKQLHINTNNFSPLIHSSSISQQHSPASLLPPYLSTEHPQQSNYSPLANNSMMQPMFLNSPGAFANGHSHHGQVAPPIPPYPKPGNSFIVENKTFSPSIPAPNVLSPTLNPQITQSPNYHKQHFNLENKLQTFWMKQIEDISKMEDFKTTHELPLARIKKIMKSDEEVNKISAEVPMLFSKACELFILEITHRSWVHTEINKRRTLQRIDIANAISRSDVFDFLVDIVPREERTNRKIIEELNKSNYPEYLQYIQMHQMDPQGIKRSYSMEITPSNSEPISPMSSPKKRSLSHDYSNGENSVSHQQQNHNVHFENHNGIQHLMDHHNLMPAPSPSYGIPSLLNYSNQNIYQSAPNPNGNHSHEIAHHNNHHHHPSSSHELTHQFHPYFFTDEHGK